MKLVCIIYTEFAQNVPIREQSEFGTPGREQAGVLMREKAAVVE